MGLEHSLIHFHVHNFSYLYISIGIYLCGLLWLAYLSLQTFFKLLQLPLSRHFLGKKYWDHPPKISNQRIILIKVQ